MFKESNLKAQRKAPIIEVRAGNSIEPAESIKRCTAWQLNKADNARGLNLCILLTEYP